MSDFTFQLTPELTTASISRLTCTAITILKFVMKNGLFADLRSCYATSSAFARSLTRLQAGALRGGNDDDDDDDDDDDVAPVLSNAAGTRGATSKVLLDLLPHAGTYAFAHAGTAWTCVIEERERVHTPGMYSSITDATFRKIDVRVITRAPSLAVARAALEALMKDAQVRAGGGRAAGGQRARGVTAACDCGTRHFRQVGSVHPTPPRPPPFPQALLDSESADVSKTVGIFSMSECGDDFRGGTTYLPKRSLRTIYLADRIKLRCKEEIERFIGEAKDYETFGIP